MTEDDDEKEKKIDSTVDEMIDRVLYGIPQDPSDDARPRPSLYTRSDAEGIREFMRIELADMMAKLTVASLGLAEGASEEEAEARTEAALTTSGGITLVAQERLHQAAEKGFTAKHDDHHKDGELRYAAICYADLDDRLADDDPATTFWPWRPEADTRAGKSELRRLICAAALLCAEIDRRMRTGETP